MEFNYKIVKQLGCIGEMRGGEFTKEINLISYNGAFPKIDIRTWDRKADRMQKGIALTIEEATTLKQILNEIDLENCTDGND